MPWTPPLRRLVIPVGDTSVSLLSACPSSLSPLPASEWHYPLPHHLPQKRRGQPGPPQSLPRPPPHCRPSCHLKLFSPAPLFHPVPRDLTCQLSSSHLPGCLVALAPPPPCLVPPTWLLRHLCPVDPCLDASTSHPPQPFPDHTAQTDRLSR